MKRIASIAMALALILGLCVNAYALDMDGGSWYVRFTQEAKMESNFTAANGSVMSEALTALQPGDSATFYMALQNNYAQSTDWYMTNEVLQSLEASQDVASGGAYSYDLTYVGPDGTTDVLYSSSSVGGEGKTLADREGLREATSSLEDFFYLDTLATGEKGQITLRVALDGETQGNAYQDTLAQLQMNFAVEIVDEGQRQNTTTVYQPVRTGDENDLFLWSAVMLVCGLAAAGLGVYTYRRNRRDEEGHNDK